MAAPEDKYLSLKAVAKNDYLGTALIFGFAILIVPILTWCISSMRSTTPPAGRGKSPPMVPYFLPYLGHTLAFLRNPDKLFRSLNNKYPNIPYTLTLLGTHFYVISTPGSVATVFSKTKDFLVDPITPSLLANAFGLPEEDQQKFNITLDAAKKPSKDLTAQEKKALEFNTVNHTVFVKYLSGKNLDWMAKTYLKSLPVVLEKKFPAADKSGVTVPFFAMMQDLMFNASVEAFFGTRFKDAYPELSKDFWLFDRGANMGARHKMMWVFQPNQLKARNRMLQHFETWVDVELEKWNDDDGEWNETWGAKLNWEREKLFRQRGFTKKGRACMQIAFLWGLNANAIAVTTWFLLLTIQTPGLVLEIRRELKEVLLPSDSPTEVRFDVAKLTAIPLLQGIYKEALRLGSATATARVVSNDIEIDGYVLMKGGVVLMPVRVLHFDKAVFDDAESFKPQRWITDENDTKESAQKIKSQTASLRTFGGGSGLCPGRYVAEQEILGSVSYLLMMFDIALKVGQEVPRPDPRNLMGMSPLGKDPQVLLCRRANPKDIN